jgi:glyoxylate reductase
MDYVTIHVPFCKETHHLIDKPELSNMKKSTYLINASRGAVVNQEALIYALRNKEIAGAALDVYETEPAVPKELTKFSNIFLGHCQFIDRK